jgi:hypothetical protein
MNLPIRVLVACEESQEVTKAFRLRGFEAFSCDIQECSGGHPEWHYQQDVFEVIDMGWDMMIGHPPCTYLSKAGARWMYPKSGNICNERLEKSNLAKDFFLSLLNADIKYIALENPTPLKIINMPPHNQVIQPYEFGHKYSKRTLLWLKNLPILFPTYMYQTPKPYLPSNTGGKKRGQSYSKGVSKNAKESSKTFPGIAKAMATQWGDYLIKQYISNEHTPIK